MRRFLHEDGFLKSEQNLIAHDRRMAALLPDLTMISSDASPSSVFLVTLLGLPFAITAMTTAAAIAASDHVDDTQQRNEPSDRRGEGMVMV
ncbi:MAG: hypothetical protein U0031_16590 [Thermomicrobiales bacterium]